MGIFSILVSIYTLCIMTDAVDQFVYKSCYETKMEDRMPLSIDNLISLVEKYEAIMTNQDPSDIAEALLGRYRQNGITYCPTTELNNWNINQVEEANKQVLDDILLNPSTNMPDNVYDNRAECSIHMMLSHSTDIYPHPGADMMWQNSIYTSSRYRRKRSTLSQDCLEGNEVALHPIENGVIQTTAGPVAAGILLAGIMSKDFTKTYTVEELIGNPPAYMPSEMNKKEVHSFYGPTISGKIGQAAVLYSKLSGSNEFEVGPSGMFGNCTSCARMFTLRDSVFSFLSRAELFASLDALIIREAFKRFNSNSGSDIKLSEILRMYYSEHGLFHFSVKACNRIKYMDYFNDNQIEEYALNYMYAYQNYFPQIKTFIKENQEDFETIEKEFKSACDAVIKEMRSFLGSYNKDDQGYLNCREYRDEAILETQADLVVVYAPQDTQEENEIEAEYITHVARGIGVGTKRSQVIVLDPGYGRWESPAKDAYTNINNKDVDYYPYFNVADWSCNFTTNLRTGGSSTQDFEDVIDELEKVYSKYYKKIRSEDDYSGIKSQILLWNLPRSFRGDVDDMRERLRVFREVYPDITYILAGPSTDPINEFLGDNKGSLSYKDIYVPTSGRNSDEITEDILPMIWASPRMFVYPACDTSNSSLEDYDEGRHVYTTYITPNRTTLIRIPPINFHFSEALKLKFNEKDFHVCVSRTNQIPSDKDNTEETYCETGNFELEQFNLCGRYVNECSPIYISATALNKNTYCSDNDCIYPNQLQFEMTHEGMTCGAGLLSSFSLFLFLTYLSLALITKFQYI